MSSERLIYSEFDEVNIIEEKAHVDINDYDIDILVDEREFENSYFDRAEQEIFLYFTKSY